MSRFDRVIAVRTLKTVYRDGDSVWKVFDAAYKKSDVLNEALNQARVEETGLPIPKVLEVAMREGKWAIVSEYIDGKTLKRLMDEEPARKDEYLARLVDLQLAVHQKRSSHLNKLRDRLHEKISASGLDYHARYDIHRRLEAMRAHDKLCHGDFTPENVVIAKDGEAYILDWAHATQGNAGADAAQTYLLLCLEGDEAGAKFYMDAFCKKSGIARSNVQGWLSIVAAARLSLGREKERELLLSWTNVADYE